MDLQPNKIDGIVKPITNTRISASEWNQLVGSCMAFITAAGFTPDADDNQQFLNAFIQIAQDIGAIGANVDLSNLSATGENHFVQLQSGVSQADVDYVVESYQNGTSWYKVYKSGWCEQGGKISESSATVALLKEMADTNYSVLITVDRSTPPPNQEGNGSGYASSTTQIFVSSGTMYNGAFWRVSGYATTGA